MYNIIRKDPSDSKSLVNYKKHIIKNEIVGLIIKMKERLPLIENLTVLRFFIIEQYKQGVFDKHKSKNLNLKDIIYSIV